MRLENRGFLDALRVTVHIDAASIVEMEGAMSQPCEALQGGVRGAMASPWTWRKASFGIQYSGS